MLSPDRYKAQSNKADRVSLGLGASLNLLDEGKDAGVLISIEPARGEKSAFGQPVNEANAPGFAHFRRSAGS